jgi:hypothetical protein
VTPEHFNAIKSDVWAECAEAYEKWLEEMRLWEMIRPQGPRPEKPSNPYCKDAR